MARSDDSEALRGKVGCVGSVADFVRAVLFFASPAAAPGRRRHLATVGKSREQSHGGHGARNSQLCKDERERAAWRERPSKQGGHAWGWARSLSVGNSSPTFL